MKITRRSRFTQSGPGPDDALGRLLANAAPRPDYGRELRGESDAAAAFREARLVPVPRPRRRPPSGHLLVSALIALAGLSGGGVAFAAAGGHFAGHPGGHHPVAPSSAVPSVSPSTAAAEGGYPPSPSPSPSRPGALARPRASQPASRSPGESDVHSHVQPTADPSARRANAPGASAGPVRVQGPVPSLPAAPSLGSVGEPSVSARVP